MAGPSCSTGAHVTERRRQRVPFWAMTALAAIPLWAFLYARALTAPPADPTGPLDLGRDTYSSCAGCHGADGTGTGTIYPFADGAITVTFPNIEDQLRWISFGTDAYQVAGIDIYGDPQRLGGPHLAGAAGTMPGWAAELTDVEILAVACYERFVLGDTDSAETHPDEYDRWCADDSAIFADLQSGGDLGTLHQRFETILPIGTSAAAGTSAAG